MEGAGSRNAAPAWDRRELGALIDELRVLRESMIEFESRLVSRIEGLDAAGERSACNLAHFLAMRSFDLRTLQDRLARIGVSSLGLAQPQVLANLDKVLGILQLLAGRPATVQNGVAYLPSGDGQLERRADALFGALPGERRTRIMVTLPSFAAFDDMFVEALVRGGMDVARIDCAHDAPSDWVAMAVRVRRAAAAAGRHVKVLMDLAGPRLRTGPIEAGPAVLKLKPERDAFGAVVQPIRLGLRPMGSQVLVPGACAYVGVDAAWLAGLDVAERIDLVDALARARRLTVLHKCDEGVLVEGTQTVYLTHKTRFRLHRRDQDVHETALGDLPVPEGRLRLCRGETLRLVRHGLGHDASVGSARKRVTVATIACTFPEVLAHVRKGERIWFDDGRIGAVVRRTTSKGVEVEITDAAAEGTELGADKGINLPDTRFDLPALTPKDIEDLSVVARHADLVGLSFAQGAGDVKLLRRHLRRLGANELGVVLKVETRHGFERLPAMLFAAMACKAAGVLIARGHLAVECGFERLAEVQEEILWACEAAHIPVVWATQGLESQAKNGLPSCCEITDAAMGVHAECVMLDKGPHILEALRTLDDILRRMTRPAEPTVRVSSPGETPDRWRAHGVVRFSR